MKSFRAAQSLQNAIFISKPCLRGCVRRSSTLSSFEEDLTKKLTNRPSRRVFGRFRGVTSHRLRSALLGFLPCCCLPSPTWSGSVPEGHHLLNFEKIVACKDLLPDGTDDLFSPGGEFVRRVWAGGSLIFERPIEFGTADFPSKEKATYISFKGKDESQKVYVQIEKIIEPYGRGPRPTIIKETKTLVFMKTQTVESLTEEGNRVPRVVKAPHKPDYSVSTTPTKHLLATFSALTYNFHRIHLDTQYAREVEGYRNILVHGPLTVILMLAVLRSQLQGFARIHTFDYKNLAPLYADEEMKICIRKDPKNHLRYDVWIEGSEGGYAVKGSAGIDLNGGCREISAEEKKPQRREVRGRNPPGNENQKERKSKAKKLQQDNVRSDPPAKGNQKKKKSKAEKAATE